MFDIPSPDGSPEEIGLTHATAYSPEGEIHLWRNGPGGEGGAPKGVEMPKVEQVAGTSEGGLSAGQMKLDDFGLKKKPGL